VYVVGNVKKPGAFPVQDSSNTSVLKILAVSEGVLPFAAKQAYIYRQEPGSETRKEIPVELTRIVRRETADVSLQGGDIFYIPDNRGRRLAVTALEGLPVLAQTRHRGCLYGVARLGRKAESATAVRCCAAAVRRRRYVRYG